MKRQTVYVATVEICSTDEHSTQRIGIFRTRKAAETAIVRRIRATHNREWLARQWEGCTTDRDRWLALDGTMDEEARFSIEHATLRGAADDPAVSLMKLENLRENVAAIAATLHTDPRFDKYAAEVSPDIGGFPAIWSLCADVGMILSELERTMPINWDDVDWVETVDLIANCIITERIGYAEHMRAKIPGLIDGSYKASGPDADANDKKIEVRILWGIPDERDPNDEPKTYSFDTEEQRRFFMIGVDEAIGYLEHEIVAPAIGTDEAAANAEHDPCGGRDCDTCEIGGCDHGRPVGGEG